MKIIVGYVHAINKLHRGFIVITNFLDPIALYISYQTNSKFCIIRFFNQCAHLSDKHLISPRKDASHLELSEHYWEDYWKDWWAPCYIYSLNEVKFLWSKIGSFSWTVTVNIEILKIEPVLCLGLWKTHANNYSLRWKLFSIGNWKLLNILESFHHRIYKNTMACATFTLKFLDFVFSLFRLIPFNILWKINMIEPQCIIFPLDVQNWWRICHAYMKQAYTFRAFETKCAYFIVMVKHHVEHLLFSNMLQAHFLLILWPLLLLIERTNYLLNIYPKDPKHLGHILNALSS